MATPDEIAERFRQSDFHDDTMPPTIRRAAASDAPDLSRLVGQYWAFESIDGHDLRGIESLLRDVLAAPDRAACWVADDNGDLTGYLFAVFVFSLEHGGLMAEVDEFFVVPGARGHGIGLALLQHAERALGRLGVVRLQLQVGVDNQHAREFYMDNGYARRSGFEIWDKPLSVV